MPIYAYRCTTCGNAQDVLRKISDPPLTVCPVCGAPTFVKQVTAAGFQLKGSGWYVTDFRDGGKKAAGGETGKGEKPSGESGDTPVKKDDGAKSTEAPGAAPAATPAAASAAPAPAAPAAAAAPAPAAKPDKGSA
jgi:putative FmdB family regulatory protein